MNRGLFYGLSKFLKNITVSKCIIEIMNEKEIEYKKCKEIALKINECLKKGYLVVDEHEHLISKSAKFIFNDRKLSIELKRSDDWGSMYCSKDGWGDPDVKVFTKFRIYKDQILLL